MCSIVTTSNGALVASVKKYHVDNIISNAGECEDIDRIILFGSSVEERCTDKSDIDIAVFSNKPRMKFLSSKSFRNFMRKVYSFDEEHGMTLFILRLEKITKNLSSKKL